MSNSQIYPNIEIFHVHIPKTAGTSLNTLFQYIYGDEFVNHDPQRLRLGVNVRAAASHTTFLSARKQFPNARFVTVLRDPVSRFKSTLRHLYARRKWPNYADIGPVIDALINAEGYVCPSKEIVFGALFMSRFDNLMVRYLTTSPVVDRIRPEHVDKAIEALPYFYRVLNQDHFDEDVVELFSSLGFPNISATHANEAKSNIPLWDEIPDIFESFLEKDLRLYAIAREKYSI